MKLEGQELYEGIIIMRKNGKTHKEIMTYFEVTNSVIQYAVKKYKKNFTLTIREPRKWSKEMLATFKKNAEINEAYEEKGGCKQNVQTRDSLVGKMIVSNSTHPTDVHGFNGGFGT